MRRTLVVDDEGPIRNLLAAVLRREGIPVDTAANGSEAVDMLAQRAYGCVVLDLMMPVMNGRELIQAMLLDRVPHAPVIVVTAAGESSTGGLDPEVVKAIIRKPFEVARLVEAARAFCEEEGDEPVEGDWVVDPPPQAM